MFSDRVKADHGQRAVVGNDEYPEGADAVFKSGKLLFDVVARVHIKLGDRAAGDDRDIFAGTGSHHRRAGKHRVDGTGAEAAHVAAGGVRAARDLGDGLREVAAAALVHVAGSLFRALDDKVDILGLHAAVLYQVEQGKDGARLAGDVHQQLVSGEVRVDLMASPRAADDLALKIERQRAGSLDFVLYLRRVVPGLKARYDILAHQGMPGYLFFGGGGEVLLKPDKVKDVADVDKGEAFILRHDLAVFPEADLFRFKVFVPGLGARLKILYLHGADVCKVRGVAGRLVIVLLILGKLFEEF